MGVILGVEINAPNYEYKTKHYLFIRKPEEEWRSHS